MVHYKYMYTFNYCIFRYTQITIIKTFIHTMTSSILLLFDCVLGKSHMSTITYISHNTFVLTVTDNNTD